MFINKKVKCNKSHRQLSRKKYTPYEISLNFRDQPKLKTNRLYWNIPDEQERRAKIVKDFPIAIIDGLNDSEIIKLDNANIRTIENLLNADPEELSKVTKISRKRFDNILQSGKIRWALKKILFFLDEKKVVTRSKLNDLINKSVYNVSDNDIEAAIEMGIKKGRIIEKNGILTSKDSHLNTTFSQ